MKRVVVTVSVPDDMEDATVALVVGDAFRDETNSDPDPVAWEWDNFWLDVSEGVISVEGEPDRAGPGGHSTESAREIAARYQSSDGMDGIAFRVFASTGTISERLSGAIEREIAQVRFMEPSNKDSLAALLALLAYVLRVQP